MNFEDVKNLVSLYINNDTTVKEGYVLIHGSNRVRRIEIRESSLLIHDYGATSWDKYDEYDFDNGMVIAVYKQENKIGDLK